MQHPQLLGYLRRGVSVEGIDEVFWWFETFLVFSFSPTSFFAFLVSSDVRQLLPPSLSCDNLVGLLEISLAFKLLL